jgi:hypothetical protein
VSREAALAVAGLALALVGLGGGALVAVQEPAPAWRPFTGTWSASGRRQTLAASGDALAAVVEVAGAVAITDGEGLSRGFQGQAVGFDDGEGVSLGRAVWTDERGDRVFSRLRGEPLQTGRRLTGTITGGTGRYADLEGEYSLTWQYLLAGEGDAIEGRAVGLSGRIRNAVGRQAPVAPAARAPR